MRTGIHDNLCYLKIKSDIGQHSQFLRCLNNSVESLFYQSWLSNEACKSLSSLGCLTSGGFRRPGSSWQMPGCARGVCAVTLQGGWQATEERCEGLVQNPQYQVRMYKKSPKNIFSSPVCDEGGREFAVPRLLCKASPVQRCYIGRDNSLKPQSLVVHKPSRH